MTAFERLQGHINRIHSDLNMRGIQSKAIVDATYCIETEARAYMGELPTYKWEGLALTPTQRIIVDLLHRHLGHTVDRDRLLDAMFSGDDERLTNPRKHIAVYICVIRKRIAQTPFEIKTVWGEGFAMLLKPSALALTALHELQAH